MDEKQRELLAAYDTGMIADLIVKPEYGLSRIKSSQAGGTCRTKVEWMRHYSTGKGAIYGGDIGGPALVSITYSQLLKWAASVPDDIRAKLAANLAEQAQERAHTWEWCRCPWSEKAPNDHSGPCTKYHPSVVENNNYHANSMRLHAYERVYVCQAIWSDTEQQLDLFAEESA